MITALKYYYLIKPEIEISTTEVDISRYIEINFSRWIDNGEILKVTFDAFTLKTTLPLEISVFCQIFRLMNTNYCIDILSKNYRYYGLKKSKNIPKHYFASNYFN